MNVQIKDALIKIGDSAIVIWLYNFNGLHIVRWTKISKDPFFWEEKSHILK